MADKLRRLIMRGFELVLILSICLILSGCSFNQNKSTADVSTTSTIGSSANDLTVAIQSNNSLINIICSRQDILGNIDINTAQILSTDSRIGLNAAIMSFINSEGKAALASAVIKNDQVINMQVSEIGDGAFLNYKTMGTDEEQGDFTLYSGVIRDDKVTNINFVYENGTVVNTKLQANGSYCYLFVKKEMNNSDIVKIQEMDDAGNIIYTVNEETRIEETTSYMTQADVQQQQTEQAISVIADYYKMMYQAYYNGDVQESMFQNSLDMTQAQNKNKITAMRKLNMNWNYFRSLYPDYAPVGSIIALHLESCLEQEDGHYEVVVQIKGNAGPADYSPEDYLIGVEQAVDNQKQAVVPPFVSLGKNTFILTNQEEKLLIQKHIYDGQKDFEGLETVEVDFDAAAYQAVLEEKQWGLK